MSRAVYRLVQQAIIKPQKTVGSVRLYARWINRNPAKVHLPFESDSKPDLKKEKIIDLDPEILNKSRGKDQSKIKLVDHNTKINQDVNEEKNETTSISREKSKEIKEKKAQALKKRDFYLNQKKVFDDNNELMYEKLKDNDSRISSLLTKLKSKKDRLRSGQVLVEGWRLIVDGLEANCKLKYLVFSRTEDLNSVRPFLPNTGVVLYKIPYKEIKLWSDVETSPGILGVFEMPKPDNVTTKSRPLPLHFICDNIRVPGNLGAILRVAVGAGCEKVFLSKGCVDLWDPKVIRSAAGAHFRLSVYNSMDWDEIHKNIENNSTVFVADSNAKVYDEEDNSQSNDADQQMPVLPYYGVQYNTFKHITLILGGETEGISENSYELAAQHNGLRLNIPLQRGVDSLNTGMATAVIAFEIRKQLIEAWTKAKSQAAMAT